MEKPLTFEISEELYDKMVAHANGLGITLDDFIVQAIRKKFNMQ